MKKLFKNALKAIVAGTVCAVVFPSTTAAIVGGCIVGLAAAI